ncbi:MAG: type II toxin-antitoxin system PrlF family antitoxin [Caulobacter sp.]|nr:type II toxin-antitoxin system PrlF family antitoxin [Caulobacter sp.]
MGYAITTKGQVTLPKRVRENLGVTPGDSVEFRLNDRGEVIVEKSGEPGAAAPRLERWRGVFGPGPTTDEVMAMTRGEDE